MTPLYTRLRRCRSSPPTVQCPRLLMVRCACGTLAAAAAAVVVAVVVAVAASEKAVAVVVAIVAAARVSERVGFAVAPEGMGFAVAPEGMGFAEFPADRGSGAVLEDWGFVNSWPAELRPAPRVVSRKRRRTCYSRGSRLRVVVVDWLLQRRADPLTESVCKPDDQTGSALTKAAACTQLATSQLDVGGRNPPASWVTVCICWAQFAHRLSLQTATLSLQTGRFQRPVCRLGETLAQFANWVSVCKLRQPSLQTR